LAQIEEDKHSYVKELWIIRILNFHSVIY
jgi:hypothetical protein